MSAVPSPSSLAHSRFEDAFALLTGTLFVAIGIAFLNAAGLGTGGRRGSRFSLR